MARPREFEVDQALRDAAEVFRFKGYHATSLEDLTDGTGLAKGSLYKAFHDKKSLFLGALDLYASESRAKYATSLQANGSPREAIRQALLDYIDRSKTASGCAGCLITNTAVELGNQDLEIAEQVRVSFAKRIDLLEKAVRRAQDAGEVDTRNDPRTLAEFLELTVQGLRVLIRTGSDEAQMRRSVDTAMVVLR